MKMKDEKTQAKAKSILKTSGKVKKITLDQGLEQYSDNSFTSPKDALAEKHKALAQVAVEQYRNKTSS